MDFDWKDYIELAQWLAQQEQSGAHPEALLRTALSRAYYGAFCHARNQAIKRLGFQSRGEAEDHGRLRALLKTGKLRGVSDKLQRLRDWRNPADYQDKLNFDPQAVLGRALREAGDVVAALAP